MQSLNSNFENREALIDYVKALAPWAKGEASNICGGQREAEKKLALINPIDYGKTRNYADGDITYLSPYIHHGIVDLNRIRNHALSKASQAEQITKFVQELAWRDFWQRVVAHHPEWVWQDVEPYKTGYNATEYLDRLPEDIATGQTGIASIDAFIHELLTQGYVHNHARMYLASYIVHFRRIRWQVGAKWFLSHLLDGDEASNNLSWQWVASTFSNKPYIFNLENVHKYFAKAVNTDPKANAPLNASYETLNQQLFPYQ